MSANMPFRPAWWLPSPHLQTLWPVFFRRPVRLALDWERVELDDGDFIDLAWHGRRTGPRVLVIHGLEGSLDSHYATPLLERLGRSGYRVAFMHLRGCSGEPNRLARSYHSGATEDLAEILRFVERNGQPIQAAIGYSLGGNLLLKYLGETGAEAALRTGVAISVPFQLRDAVRRMEQGASRLYGRYLLDRLKRAYRIRFSRIPSPLSADINTVTSIYDFDDRVTAPLNNFADADDYYHRCSCIHYLSGIEKPTLILHARDDPFMYPDNIPAADRVGPGVELEVTARGGHVGFVSGRWPWRPDYWAEQRIGAFLARHLPVSAQFV